MPKIHKVLNKSDIYLSITSVNSSAETIDLFVDLGTMMVTLLTSTGHGEGDTTWMPSTDTSDLTQTLVSLTG